MIEYGILYILYFYMAQKGWKGIDFGISSNTRMRGHQMEVIETDFNANKRRWTCSMPCQRILQMQKASRGDCGSS